MDITQYLFIAFIIVFGIVLYRVLKPSKTTQPSTPYIGGGNGSDGQADGTPTKEME